MAGRKSLLALAAEAVPVVCLAGVDPDLVAARPVRCLVRIAVCMQAFDVTGSRGLLVAGMCRIQVTATARPGPHLVTADRLR
ncbi:hypothetical protein [Nonomuraea sp. NPDC049784]|uniref:hypothetical protein n=1 Tax=Nonomuraea sp. NPDC049784 TaxID=3154361 RepID=UPI0033CD3FAF